MITIIAKVYFREIVRTVNGLVHGVKEKTLIVLFLFDLALELCLHLCHWAALVYPFVVVHAHVVHIIR
jgi:hypothetical protein